MTNTNKIRAKFKDWFESTFEEETVWQQERNCFEELVHHRAWKGYQAATLKAAPQWLPVDQNVPRTADELLTLNRAGHRTIRTGNYLYHMMHAAVVDKEDCFYVLYMPLPAPPAPGGDK